MRLIAKKKMGIPTIAVVTKPFTLKERKINTSLKEEILKA